MEKRVNKKIKNYNEIFAEVYIFIFILFFSSLFFYIDPTITGFSVFGYNVADNTRPNITINAPVNNTNFSYTNVTFNLTIGEDNLIVNVSIIGNWTGTFVTNTTNTSSALANNITVFVINISQGRGYYLWAARACDNSSNCNYTSNTTLFINRLPEITSINVSNDHSANKTNGNLTGVFNYLDPDSDVQSLNETRWYNNSIEITAFRNFTSVDYLNTTAGDNWIFSARVFDNENWSNWFNSSGHSIQNNQAPTFTGTISNQQWLEDASQNNAFNLSTFFSDPEIDNITYTSIGNKAITVSISVGVVSFSQVADFFGTEYVVFVANDTNLTRNSNNVTLTVSQVDEPVEQTQLGGGVSRERPAISIVAPTPKTIYLKDKIVVPLTLKNSGDIFLQGIKLNAFSAEQKIKTNLGKTFIPSLAQGTEEIVNLEILSDLDKDKQAIEIFVNAEVNSPQLKDSTTIYLNAIEFGAANKSVIIPRLEYARDLFSKNEKCQNLKEIISKAELLVSQNNLNEAKSLIDEAINGCNDIVVLQPKKLELSKEKANENVILLIELLILFILTISLVLYFKKGRKSYLKI